MMRIRPAAPVLSLAAALAGAVCLIAPAPAAAQKPGGRSPSCGHRPRVARSPARDDGAGAWVYFNMLEPLLTMDEKMPLRPALATSYEVLSPTKVRFEAAAGGQVPRRHAVQRRGGEVHLRPALRGTPPARWASLRRLLPAPRSSTTSPWMSRREEPYGPILRTLAMYCTGIVSPTAVQKMGENFSRAPVGTGPCPLSRVEDHRPSVILERNPNYWGEKARSTAWSSRWCPRKARA